MAKKLTQDDHVKEDMALSGYAEPVITKLTPPGIQTLHTRPMTEITETLYNVLRSQTNIRELRWVIGECFEITSDPLG
jgi:hypothetical protein